MSAPALKPDQYDQFKLDYACLKSIKALAELWQMDYQTARRWVHRLKLEVDRSRKPADWSKDPDLGKVPDRVIADRYGITRQRVGVGRKALGIPTFQPQRTAKRKPEVEAGP